MLKGFAPQRPRGRPGRLPERRRLPRVLSLSQVEAILRAQRRLRDRFLFALLFQTGMQVGQALGLRHEDVVTWENRIEIVCRGDNANGARAKGSEGSVLVAAALMRLYGEYMHVEYGSLDSDYVFVNRGAAASGGHSLTRRSTTSCWRHATRSGFTSPRIRSGTRTRRSAGGRGCRLRWWSAS